MSKRTKKPESMSAKDLAKANRFDLSALAQNRHGQLSGSQTIRLLLKLISIALSTLIASIFSCVCFFFAAKTVPWESLTANWEELAIALLLFLLGLFWLWDPIRAIVKVGIPLLLDLFGGQVKIEQGAVGKHYDDTVYRSLWHRIFDWIFGFFSDGFDKYLEPFRGAHYYTLNKQEFMVSQKGYNALNEGSAYRLYYLARSRKLVNIEPFTNQSN